jgi:hypothetical protein
MRNEWRLVLLIMLTRKNSGATHWFRYMFYLVIMFNILVEDEFESHY